MRPTRLIAMLLLAAYLPACTSYQVMADPTDNLQAVPFQLNEIRVTPMNGKRFTLRAPEVFGDSLRGFLKDGTLKRMALVDVKKVEAHVVDPEKSMLMVDVVMCMITSALGDASECSSEGWESTEE